MRLRGHADFTQLPSSRVCPGSIPALWPGARIPDLPSQANSTSSNISAGHELCRKS
jgi:hypothetical protein